MLRAPTWYQPRLAVPAAKSNPPQGGLFFAGIFYDVPNEWNGRMLNMNARNLLFTQFGVVAILAGIHIPAIVNSLYWRFRWIDMPIHLIGGLWAALFASWLLALRKKKPTLAFCVLAALAFGIVWEFFEAYFGLTSFPADILDTIKDLSMNIIGAVSGVFLALALTNP